MNVAAPGHVPWDQPEDVPPIHWIPEGSSYSPETFRDALCRKRSLWHKNSRKAVFASETSEVSRRGQELAKSDLVFEREVTLRTDGQPRRLSLQIPATSMNPEMVDLMLELKNLSSFFSGEPPPISPEKKNTLIPPTLVVSNSEISVPINLDAVGDSPLPLATRRGKKMPIPLELKTETGPDAYPDIPTAFLGSPSCYSPKFEFAATASRQSMDFQDMINSLRSQCIALERSYTCDDEVASTKSDVSSAPVEASQKPNDDDDDEWAFAAQLMKTYGDGIDFDVDLLPETERPSCCPRSPPSESALHHNSSSGMGSDSVADISDESPDTSLESIKVCQNRANEPSLSHITRPSAPLPLRPALAIPSSVRAAQGFLKNCKSVRFASLPSRHEPPPPMDSPSPDFPAAAAAPPRRSFGTPTNLAALRRPSPLRQSLAAEYDNPRPRPGRFVSPPPRAASNGSPPAGRKPVPAQTTTSRSPLVLMANKPPAIHTFPFRRSSAKDSAAVGEKADRSRSLSTESGRRSLGRLMSASDGKEKENKSGPLSSQSKSGWSALDENILRRESGAAGPQIRSGSSKSRMPLPLRNIFKFK